MPKLVHRAAVPPEQAKKILSILRRGHTIRAACAGAEVHRDTYYDWIARAARVGTPDEQPTDKQYSEFAAAAEMAKDQGELVIAELLRKNLCGPKFGKRAKDTASAQWWLAHRNPEDWSPKLKTELSGPGGGPIAIADVHTLSDEDLQALIDGTYMPKTAPKSVADPPPPRKTVTKPSTRKA